MTRLAPCQNGRRLFQESPRKSMVTSHLARNSPSCPWSDVSKDVGNSYVGHPVPAKRENSAPPLSSFYAMVQVEKLIINLILEKLDFMQISPFFFSYGNL
ncbi:hypothetical protein CDAR_525121 [Caerostris darwini]|uniref:Uncharacterized protein n=1 Tax=Caerostris darwini TaxID=1538125 RepID=A0AAV4R0M2_9ARAC|nr:hypothetical protein CDAR_525121 [Caerostris darwini]